MILTLGLNHHNAPLAIREQVAFGPEKMESAFASLKKITEESLILSTCNRTEIYAVGAEKEALIAWLCAFHTLKESEIRPFLYALDNTQSIAHAFSVASGLDSMVLGETQILGQMKDAMRCAEKFAALGSLLQKLFQSAFSAAKAVRTNTSIGANTVSMAAACVHLAERIFENISEQTILFIGAGEMIEHCAAHFGAKNPKKMMVANRTLERGRLLAEKYHADSLTLNALNDYLPLADIVISCTASPLPIIGLGMSVRAIKERRHQPMFMVDLAVPRDIEPEIAALDDVFLYSVDDLKEIVAEGTQSRENAKHQAQCIIDEHTQTFSQWQNARAVVPLIRSLRENAERIRRNEMEKALKALKKGEDVQQVLLQLSNRITNKFLHAPCQTLQTHHHLKNAAQELFHLHDS